MRGMHKAQTAQQVIDAIRIHYNFCREHQTLLKTLAEQAGIRLNLQQNKIHSLFSIIYILLAGKYSDFGCNLIVSFFYVAFSYPTQS